MRALWHYTCEHTHAAIGETGTLLPAVALAPAADEFWQAHLIWVTDLPVPQRAALGLTSRFITCDRTAYRYRVTDTSSVRRWLAVRRDYPGAWELEAAPGARPAHWYVSAQPVPVVLDTVPKRSDAH